MPQPRIPAGLAEELAAMDLTLWVCMHTMIYPEPGSKGKHDTTQVDVQLAGPGLGDYSPWGHGSNVREAVDAALAHPDLISRVTGLKGAIMRLDRALGDVAHDLLLKRYVRDRPPQPTKYPGVVNYDDLDEDIPF